MTKGPDGQDGNELARRGNGGGNDGCAGNRQKDEDLTRARRHFQSRIFWLGTVETMSAVVIAFVPLPTLLDEPL
jgi:hypothetical protein